MSVRVGESLKTPRIDGVVRVGRGRQRPDRRVRLRRGGAGGSSRRVPSLIEVAVPLGAASRWSVAHVVPGSGQSAPVGGDEAPVEHVLAVAVGEEQLHGRLVVDAVVDVAQVAVEPRGPLAVGAAGAGGDAVVGADDEEVGAVVAQLLERLERAAGLDVEEAVDHEDRAGRSRRRGTRARASSRRGSGGAGSRPAAGPSRRRRRRPTAGRARTGPGPCCTSGAPMSPNTPAAGIPLGTPPG